MWIRDIHDRLLNLDNATHIKIRDINDDKRKNKGSEHLPEKYVIEVRWLKTEGVHLFWLTEITEDKDEAEIRFLKIIEAIKNNEQYLELE